MDKTDFIYIVCLICLISIICAFLTLSFFCYCDDECTIFVHRNRMHMWQLRWELYFICMLNNDITAEVSKNDLSILNTQQYFSNHQIRTLNFLNKNSGTV